VLLPPAGSFDFGATDSSTIVSRCCARALLHGRSLHLPRDFRALVEACYGDGTIPEEWAASASR
jgi:hypothetical protein